MKRRHSGFNYDEITGRIETAIAAVAPDCRKHVLYQIGSNKSLHFSINYSCPPDKAQLIERALHEVANQYELTVTTGRMAD